ncbi:polyketide synthase Pks13 [Corynebacterium caspium]|uniref:polyketide synthase Pks13 n=1 Tax=Corynebacterium caspium TaxID=234828 RepID=UPI0003690643|nr:type I polyketide synthase [Corynebacterium caspium]WKD59979.1 Phthiocerol/phenolphthiocerol synthesis polyketide synthase type I PpsA [Corynebacterium caspium DSM 44850]
MTGAKETRPTTAMSVDQVRAWLQSWIVDATGLTAAEVTDDKPLEAFGLSSRDVVLLSGELESLLGVRLDATIAYEYPTIRALAKRLVEGEAVVTQRRKQSLAKNWEQSDAPDIHDIAVVGMAAKYPGAESTAQMWEAFVTGRDGLGQPPLGRWSEYAGDEVMAAKMATQNLTGGYLQDISAFDAEFFGLSPVEAMNMDPQQRIMLELAWEALEDAGIPANTLRGKSVGVFVGSSNVDYGMLISADPAEAHPYALTGTSSAIIPNRISYALDFRGPSVNVDTACSSSLVATHQAIRALRGGEADIALAGGVNILASPFVSTAFGELGVISPSGAIHAFSDDADGFVRGDGAGLLVLKRVRDAIAAGDNILAVIKGSGVNSDGHSNGLTAPNPEAQIDVLERAYRDAGVDPSQVDYVEAHGTGTILGDPIEATALGAVLGEGRTNLNPTLLGSAKTNFGHTEAAAGTAGLIKVIQAIQNDILPPSLFFSEPNRYIDFDNEHLEVVEDPREWPEYSGRKIAGVSGFGFGGTNAHVVLTDFDPADYPISPTTSTDSPAAATTTDSAAATAAQLADPTDPTVVLTLSGLLPSRRRDAATALADYLEANPKTDLIALERTLAGRNHGRSRAVVQAASTTEAIKRLRQVGEGVVSVGISAADAPQAQGPVFVYSGFGSQHRKMAKELVGLSPLFAARLAELDEVVEFESGWSVLDLINDDGQTYNTETAQVAITAIQIALTDLLAAFGVKPAAVTAMSMGEIAAAYATGGLKAADAMLIACHRARLMGEGEETLSPEQQGAMAVVELSTTELAEAIANNPAYAGIEPAVYTAPGMLTVGGPKLAVEALVAQLESQAKFARQLQVKGAGHTSMLDPIMGELEAAIAGLEAHPLHTPLISSVDRARTYQPGEIVHDEAYFLRCTRQAVWFQDATETVLSQGFSTLVEISPNPVALMGMMGTAFAVGKSDAQLLYVLKRKESAAASVRNLLAALYAQGVNVDFRLLHGIAGSRVAAPHTVWKRRRYWTAARPNSGAGKGLPGLRVALPDGSLAYRVDASEVPSIFALLEAAISDVAAEAVLSAVEELAELPATGEITTTVRRNLGGIAVSVYAMEPAPKLVAEGFAALGVAVSQTVSDFGVAPITATAEPEPTLEVEALVWDPSSGESVEERLRAIVSESMGYAVDDLPVELPLIDLGLDSLMGMRIKNRIENDFQIPPLQVQALRDASVADVIALVEELVANKNSSTGNTTPALATATPAPTAAPAPAATTATPATGVGVAPRDASERLVFGTWAGITGVAPAGVSSELPAVSVEVATQIAKRLSERSGSEITVAQVQAAATLEPLADLVRESLEREVDGNIRVLRERPAGSQAPAVFMFHPAGGSSVVYQPLMRRLPAEVPVYGVERLEGSLEDRAAAYLDEIVQYAAGFPVVLGGWSFGGALAYEVAHQLQEADAEVEIAGIALLDTVQPAHPVPDTKEEVKARWQRYAAFAKKTYGLDFPVPFDLLETAGEDALLAMMAEFLSNTDASEHGLSAGVLEHQRASFVDNRILDKLDFSRWAAVDVPVILFRAERMHDGAIELEPAYADIAADGGWSVIVRDLEIVQLRGDHLAVVDEPEIGRVGAVLTRFIQQFEQERN